MLCWPYSVQLQLLNQSLSYRLTDYFYAWGFLQVLRGYIGDRSAKPVFDGSSPFDILGGGYQRPFELATLRLFNMFGVLSKCELKWVRGNGKHFCRQLHM